MSKFMFSAWDRVGTRFEVVVDCVDFMIDAWPKKLHLKQLKLVHHDGHLYRAIDEVLPIQYEEGLDAVLPPNPKIWHPVGYVQIHDPEGGSGVIKCKRNEVTEINGKSIYPEHLRRIYALNKKLDETFGPDDDAEQKEEDKS